MLTLYDADRCPYCARVRIVLAQKGLSYETVVVDLDDRPAWIYAKNPLGKVPVLEEDDLVLPESVVIMEYLEERYPEPALWPADPAARAAGRLLVERFGRLSGERLTELDALLEAQPFLTGPEYGLADIAYVPWLLRLELDGHPRLAEWLARLAERPPVAAEVELHAASASFGSVHVQTDDQAAVERAVARFAPRIARSPATVVSAPRNGWIGVYNEVAGHEPERLRKLASELSNITGGIVLALSAERGAVVRLVAFERGRIMDEYLSVPEFYGLLPPGDAMALRANPTLLARLTGAEPAAIRAVARAGDSPAELPPAPELLADLAEALGIEGAGLSFEDARNLKGAITLEHD